MEPQIDQKNSQMIQNVSDDEEDEVHIINSKTKQPTLMKLKSEDSYEKQRFIGMESKVYEKNITAVIKNWTTDRNLIKLETHYFQVYLTQNQYSNLKKWEISRRYSDFQWLFNALRYSYPGCILPYLPIKTIQSFMITKLGIQLGQQDKQEQMHIRKSQLQIFINKICSHDKLKNAEETKIFLTYPKQQFQKSKDAIKAQIEEAKASQSSNNGLKSIFERGMAWFSTNNQNNSINIDDTEGWYQVQQEIRNWIKQFTQIVQKVKNMMAIKTQQINWQGPDTQLDSIQQFKAKIASGRQFNQLFLEQLQHKIIRSIEYETKWLKQLQMQLEQRENIINVLNYVYKYTNDSNRGNKLTRKKEKFEVNMMKEWQQARTQLKQKIRSVHTNFNQSWKTYCYKMHKIWKPK